MAFAPHRPLSGEALTRLIRRRDKTNATARTRCGAVVKSVEELADLASLKQSVYCDYCWGLLPAVVVMNMSASQVERAVRHGDIYRYIKP